MSGGPGRASLGAILFFAVLIASLAFAVLVVRARSPDLVLEVESITCAFEPDAERGVEQASFDFFVREADPHAAVSIVDSEEDVVAVLDPDVSLGVGEDASYTWNGRNEAGRLAAPGRYRLSVELPEADRTMIWPERVVLGFGQTSPDRCDPEPEEA